MTTLQQVELGVLGPLQVRQYGLPVTIPGAKPRAVLTMLGLHGGSVVSADTLVELLWGADPPRTAAKALQTHISSLRRALGDGFVLTEGTGWTLSTTEIDASRYKIAVKMGREAVAAGDTSQAVARFDEARTLWRGTPELPDSPRGVSEKTRWIEGHAAVVEDRADALLATGRAAEIIGELEAAVADAPLRERRWGQLMLALYRAGRQGEALGAYQRARSLLADELGVDPGPDLRRLEAAIVAQDAALEMPVSQQLSAVTRAVTFLLTDIEGSTAVWEADADAMAVALARHDEIVEQVVTSRGGRLIKTRGEGDATFSVFDRPSAAAAAAIELQEAILHEPWALLQPMRIRVALHTGEVELRDGDYFGRAVNRAARLRSLAAGGQILCSGATAELVIDSLPDDVVLLDLGTRQLRNLARPEHVFELRLETADDSRAPAIEAPMERPGLPAVLAGPGPFVGRGRELERLLSAWQTTLDAGTRAVLIAGEPGVGKTRLAGEWCRQAYEQGAVVLYGRCDEDLGAPYQPFAEALRSLVPCLGTTRLRGLRGVEALLPLIPGLTDVLPDLAAGPRADADTERYALFDAVVALMGIASASAPVVLVLDDLHWAAKPTLLLLRHLLRFGEHARVQIVGTYRSTDLDRSHPLAAMLADLHRDGSANRLQLSGLDEDDVTTYVAEAGYDDEELARALASVTGGNPFFLIEALRHVEESGGHWDPSTLPQGVREAVSRRLSRLPAETNKALAAAAVVGSRFAVDLVERVVDGDLVDAFDEACRAGIVIEEPGGRYRFNHAIVRQSLLAELASVRRMRLHQRIAATLETEHGSEDELLAELAYHYFECAWAGNAAKAVEYCRRAADQAMARLAYEGAADLYDKALHALEELDEELPDREDLQAELLVARCEALLAAGDVASAAGAVSQLQDAAGDSARLAAWGTCFDGQLSMLTHPERLDEIESAVAAAAEKLAGLDDAAGEAKAHTVRAACLGRLGRIADCETALDQALTAARRAGEHRRVNGVLANAPLAALWGPNPVPRAGGRCLDVVRLLRITTGSPVVEATSTRCQGVLDALRGRAAAGRQLIESARRTLTELGMRHALLEVDQFAGIVELVADDPASAETHLRRAYNGFRRMGLDADTAETAALLARACLALDREAEADELCTESEHLAGHALKASIAWRTVRAQLLARRGDHDEAKRVAEEAVALAERTDALVDHGDACVALATVLGGAGDTAGARAAAEQAVGLYERKGAAALAEKARSLLVSPSPALPVRPEPPTVELDNACVRAGGRVVDAVDRQAWGEIEQLFAPVVSIESRRKVVGFPRIHRLVSEYASEARRYHETGPVRYRQLVVAVRGERLALLRLELGTPDVSPGAPQDEFLQLYGLDEDGRIALEVWFDVEDIDAAMAELDAAHARLEAVRPRVPLENAASRGEHHFNALFADRRWDEIAALLADDIQVEERRRGIRRESSDRAKEMEEIRVIADLGVKSMTSETLAIRGERLVLSRTRFSGRDQRPDAFHTELFRVAEMDDDERLAAVVTFDLDDFEAAFEELDARYLAGEAAPYTRSWQILMDGIGELNRHERGPTLEGLSYADHRRIPFAPGDYGRAIEDLWALVPDAHYRATAVHVLDARGTVFTLAFQGTDTRGNELQWTRTCSWVFDEGRVEVYEDDDLDAALAKFDELHPHAKLENAASRVYERFWSYYNARDWTALAELVVDDLSTDDRRRVVNAGVQHGRDVEFANIRSLAEIGVSATDTVLATRGQQLVLTRCSANTDEGHGEFTADMLCLIEIDSEDHIMAGVIFDLDDIDAAFAELNARYLAGEAAPYAEVWQMLMDGADTLNRHEPGALLAQRKVAFADHRRIPFAAEDFGHATERLWALVPDVRYRAAAVHALDTHGAVINLVVEGTDAHGNELQWSATDVITFVSGQTRVEVYEEHDIDAALARFEELRPHARLENAASNAYDRIKAYFATRDWDGVREILAEDVCTDDRRRVVNAGRRQGRDAAVAEIVAIAEVGVAKVTTETIAIRGRRLALSRGRAAEADQRPDAFHTDLLDIVEVDADERVVARVIFDPDDFDAAFEELDARYLAGEAAPHAHTWSAIAHAYTAFNRRELFPTTPGWVHIDHRRGTTVAPGDLQAFIRASWHDTPDVRIYIEAVHRLDQIGAVATSASQGASQEGFDAEWREIAVTTVHGNMISRSELFDEADLDAALARFDELNRPAPRLENAASRADDRFFAYFAARDWDSMAEAMTQGMMCDDRRRVVNAGIRRGRDVEIANMRAIAEVGVTNVTPRVVATRGERLVLTLARYSGGDPRADAFHTELIDLVEIDADNRIAACVLFEPDDIDAAFEELEARYLAGEAAAHSHTWSVAVETAAGLNRRELPSTTPDYVDVDHRSHAPFEDGDLKAYIGAVWDITPDITIYIESVHRLSNLGSVVTYVSHGTSQEGFDAEWREIVLGTVEGNLINRCELFDETDLDTALARFDELSRPAPRLENAASRVDERFNAYFAARDWDAMAEMLTDDFSNDDRRRTVNAGIRHGRDAEIANLRTLVDLGAKNMTSVVIATRGGRLALTLTRISGGDEQTEAFHAEVLQIVEIDADERYAAVVTFDDDNLDAAFEELDARYLAGEAAAHAHTWSLIARTYAAVNRHELPPTTLDHVSLDHHRAAFAPGDLIANLRAGWNQVPDVRFRVEAVHRLSNLGAVVTHAARGTSREGFEAEWREIHLTTVEGDLFNRSEMFDEADIDAALARFDELSRPAPRLENAASQVCERFRASFAARDWDAMAEMVADDLYNEDRRRAVNAGIRHGRDSMLQDMRAAADIGVTHLTAVEIATRGERLVLVHGDARTDEQPGAFHTDVLQIAEIGADERIAALVMFDPDDIDAAFEELDARYLAGEAAAYADTWSMILRLSAAFNKRELPAATPNWVNIDHRRGTAFPPGELGAYVRATWDLTPTAATYIEAVHRLDNIGAVVTQAADATSPNGFAAEWRVINLLTVEGDLMSRCEIFDEADIDAALAKFDELSRPAPRLENAASQVYGRFFGYFAARDWAALAELIANHVSVDDRRRVVNAGVRQGRDAMIAEVSAIAEVGVQSLTSHTIATRGDRLALSRVRALTSDQRHDAFDAEALNIIEVDADERVVARVVFDIDDVDAAFKELDARYLAGEAAAHAHTWSVIANAYAVLNRHELPATTPDWVNIDHRRGIAVAPGDMTANIRAAWDQTPDLSHYIESVHRLSELGVVVTRVVKGSSQEGFDAEWRIIDLLTVEGDLINQCEIFDEADIDAALARFDDLSRPGWRLENAASKANDHYDACFAARDWDAMAETLAVDHSSDDRRRVVNGGIRHGRDAEIVNMRAVAELGVANAKSVVIATRGQRLALSRSRFTGRDQGPGAYQTQLLDIVEIDATNRIAARVAFDLDDIDAAFEELDARYLAGEAAAHAHTWSLVAGAYTALNRRKFPATTPDFVNVDHRRVTAFAPGDAAPYIRALWDVAPDVKFYVEAVHRLSDLGVVVTHTVHGTTQEGFEADWREIELATVDGDQFNRSELFDGADIDAALARFDELSRPVSRLENATSRVDDRLVASFAERDWDGVRNVMADDYCFDDHRRVVNVGVLHGRDVALANVQATTDPGFMFWTSEVIATRGERLALSRVRWSGDDQRPDAFHTEVLNISEINADQRIATRAWFEADDIEAAFAYLDARYLAGEAAAHSHTWSVIADAYIAFNRRELAATTPDSISIDHRRGAAFAPGDMAAYLLAAWDDSPETRIHVDAVHRLSDLGAVVTHAATGVSREGFEAEWRDINLLTVEGDLINRSELFDETDLDAALARFDELSRPAPRLENAASQVAERFLAHFATRDWDAIAEILADDFLGEDRRPVVGAGIRHDRDMEIASIRAGADLGGTNMTSPVIATRGARLILTRTRHWGRDQAPEAFRIDVLALVEIDSDERIVARIVFDPDDIDAAFEELDARYLAGEAAAHADVWSVITQAYAVLNRRELPPTTPDWVNIDHRRGPSFAPGDMPALLDAVWKLTTNLSSSIEAVHRLNGLGAVVTHAAHETSQEGFDAEWRVISVLTVEGELIDRCEVFDDTDLDAALARFDELNRLPRPLENMASQATERFLACFAARDWTGMAETLAEGSSTDDRRRVVGAGVIRGRDNDIATMRASAEVGVTNIAPTLIATRGERLALGRARFSGRDLGPEAFHIEVLGIVEINADNQITARVFFDLDDIDAAFAELDARYLAGEAAAHAGAWSVVAGAYATINRRELPATTQDFVNIDHRRVITTELGDLGANIRAAWDLAPDWVNRIETVHRLNNSGAVVTRAANGTSLGGFAAEWRSIDVVTVDRHLLSRCEFFDEADLDAALARFDELSASAPQLQNAATQARARAANAANRRDVDDILALAATDGRYEDRRKMLRDEGPAGPAFVRAWFDATRGALVETAPIAIRGSHLGLTRDTYRDVVDANQAIAAEHLTLTEVNDDELVRNSVFFDLDDVNAAFGELTARWIASGEVAHPEIIERELRLIEAANRHEWDAFAEISAGATYVNHRQLSADGVHTIAAHMSSIQTMASLVPDMRMELAEVLGHSASVVLTQLIVKGTSTDGVVMELPLFVIDVHDGEHVTHMETFDIDQRDLALARFQELNG